MGTRSTRPRPPCFHGFPGAALILRADIQQLQGIQQIIDGIGAVPHFMLQPQSGIDGSENPLVKIQAMGGFVFPIIWLIREPPSPKKPSQL